MAAFPTETNATVSSGTFDIVIIDDLTLDDASEHAGEFERVCSDTLELEDSVLVGPPLTFAEPTLLLPGDIVVVPPMLYAFRSRGPRGPPWS